MPPPPLRLLRLLPPLRQLSRAFSLSLPAHGPKPLPPLPVLLDAEITESFLRGTGPGGQKINKTSCAVQLIHHPTRIVVKCQESRSQTVNRAVARKWLAQRIEERLLGEASRTKVKEKKEGDRKRSAEKKRRRKYRALAEGKEATAGEDTTPPPDEGKTP